MAFAVPKSFFALRFTSFRSHRRLSNVSFQWPPTLGIYTGLTPFELLQYQAVVAYHCLNPHSLNVHPRHI